MLPTVCIQERKKEGTQRAFTPVAGAACSSSAAGAGAATAACHQCAPGGQAGRQATGLTSRCSCGCLCAEPLSFAVQHLEWVQVS